MSCRGAGAGPVCRAQRQRRARRRPVQRGRAQPRMGRLPEVPEPLAPGDTRQLSFTLALPAGYPPSELRAALHARALTPGTLVPLARPVSADVVLRVAETGLVEVDHARRGVRRLPRAVPGIGPQPWAGAASSRAVGVEPGGPGRVVHQAGPAGARRSGQGTSRGRVQTCSYGTGPAGALRGQGERPGCACKPRWDLCAKAVAVDVVVEGRGDPHDAGVFRCAGDVHRRQAHQYLRAEPHRRPHFEGAGQAESQAGRVVPRKSVPRKTTTTGGGGASNSPPPKSSGVPGQTGSTTTPRRQRGRQAGDDGDNVGTSAPGKSAPGTSAPGTLSAPGYVRPSHVRSQPRQPQLRQPSRRLPPRQSRPRRRRPPARTWL